MDNVSRSASAAYASYAKHAPFNVHFSWSFLFPLGALYLWLASSLRFRRVEAVKKKYGYSTRDQMAKMTDNEAQEILRIISDLEFPAMFEKGLQLALFRSM
jgi:hypothetical protein